jgi:hypothetical protein
MPTTSSDCLKIQAPQMSEPAACTNENWIIVTQVKSMRVVYFTDDANYQPATDADWYYCSPYPGQLPEQMTLRNCWGWRFNGGVFIDAREKHKKSTRESLIENNRKALLCMLHEKINNIRQPFLPSCDFGEELRRNKLQQAQTYLALSKIKAQTSLDNNDFPQLQAVAVARNISLLSAAKLITDKAAETQRVLQETERFREQLSQAIAQAQTQQQLLEIREWMLDKVYPELSKQFKFRVENTEPIDLNKALTEAHRRHEIARLKAQLRECINRQRAPFASDYLLNDEIRKHKARIAQAVLANAGQVPEEMDGSVLEAYAQARQLELPAAAELTLQSMATTANILLRTEAVKDYCLARIDAIQTLEDIRSVDAALDELEAQS